MKRYLKLAVAVITVYSLSIPAGFAAADVEITWVQQKIPNIAGWRIYISSHRAGSEPTPQVSADTLGHQYFFDLRAFAPQSQNTLPHSDMPLGLKVKSYQNSTENIWLASYSFYLPPSPQFQDWIYYIGIVVYDHSGNTSAMSKPANIRIDPPGTPGRPGPVGLASDMMTSYTLQNFSKPLILWKISGACD